MLAEITWHVTWWWWWYSWRAPQSSHDMSSAQSVVTQQRAVCKPWPHHPVQWIAWSSDELRVSPCSPVQIMRNNREAILMCPRHSQVSGEQNQPRSRAPLMECCLYTEALRQTGQQTSPDILMELDQHRQYLASARYAQIMRKNIKIPSNYYISTDPRTLPAGVIKSVASSIRERERPRRLVMRSASNVTVRRAQYVKLATASVKRSSSMSCQLVSVPSERLLGPSLGREYRKAGIGVCLKGKLLIVWKRKFDLLPLPSITGSWPSNWGWDPSICK